MEASYLGLFDWNDFQSVRNLDTNALGTQGNLFSPFTGFGNPAQAGLDYNSFVSIASETQLNTGEFNFRRRIDLPSSGFQASGIWGFRYISLADRFSYRSQSNSPLPGGSTVADDVIASNRMFGTQIGGALQMHVERRAWIDVETKGMMFTNDSSQNTTFGRADVCRDHTGPRANVIGNLFHAPDPDSDPNAATATFSVAAIHRTATGDNAYRVSNIASPFNICIPCIDHCNTIAE